MPTPLAHALAGYALSRLQGGPRARSAVPPPPHGADLPAAAAPPGAPPLPAARRAAVLIGVAMLPDADLLPGLLLGQRNLLHHGFTHGLPFALAVAALVGVIFRHRWGAARAAGTALAAMGSHILLDMLTGARLGLHPAYGLALLSPLREGSVRLPLSLLPGTGPGLLTARNVAAVATEIVLFGAIALAAARLARPRGEGA